MSGNVSYSYLLIHSIIQNDIYNNLHTLSTYYVPETDEETEATRC